MEVWGVQNTYGVLRDSGNAFQGRDSIGERRPPAPFQLGKTNMIHCDSGTRQARTNCYGADNDAPTGDCISCSVDPAALFCSLFVSRALVGDVIFLKEKEKHLLLSFRCSQNN